MDRFSCKVYRKLAVFNPKLVGVSCKFSHHLIPGSKKSYISYIYIHILGIRMVYMFYPVNIAKPLGD